MRTRPTRRSRVRRRLGRRAPELLELIELAWHDCYRDIAPPEEIIDNMLILSDGSVEGLIVSARLGITDWRDVKVAADARRSRPQLVRSGRFANRALDP
jgi:hypothetical protein